MSFYTRCLSGMADILAHLRPKRKRFYLLRKVQSKPKWKKGNPEHEYYVGDMRCQLIVATGPYKKMQGYCDRLNAMSERGEIPWHNPMSIQAAMKGWAPWEKGRAV